MVRPNIFPVFRVDKLSGMEQTSKIVVHEDRVKGNNDSNDDSGNSDDEPSNVRALIICHFPMNYVRIMGCLVGVVE